MRHARGAAGEDHASHPVGVDAGVAERSLHGEPEAGQQRLGQSLELAAGDFVLDRSLIVHDAKRCAIRFSQPALGEFSLAAKRRLRD
jgi:hypothetical protein